MRSILCYGDSNTWGSDPERPGRFPRETRWPGRLQQELGTDYYVIEEGLGGRTTVWDDPIEEHKNGKTYLYPCLESHKPIDLVVLMLGTNDLKKRFSLAAVDVALGVARLVQIIQKSAAGPGDRAPALLVLAPPPIGKMPGMLEDMFTGAFEKSPRLSAYIREVCQNYGCAFLDTTEFLQPCPAEGLHLDAHAHEILANRVALKIKEIFTN